MKRTKPSAVTWTLTESSRNVHSIRIDSAGVGWNQAVLLSSDHHWDNPHCDRDLLRQHLDEAQAVGAPVIIYGDFFCAMQGRFDRRSSKDDIRPEHQKGDYLDALVNTAADYLAPYADVLAIIGPGNHETAILKHHETNLTERLVEKIRTRCPKTQLRLGGFSGWVRFQFHRAAQTQSVRLWYHHGYGGGGPVTRGVIQTNRRAAYIADADIIATGHTHDAWEVPIQRVRLSDANRVEHGEQLHISTPGYKEEYGDGYGGYHIEGGRPPKPIGACWVNFTRQNDRVVYEARRAKPGVRLVSNVAYMPTQRRRCGQPSVA
jgi:hypothetical protein